jgi:hypothetical protein
MQPNEPTTPPPNAPEPEGNPVPAPQPQPEPETPAPAEPAQSPIAQQFNPEQAQPTTATPNTGVTSSELPSAFKLFKPSWEAVKLNFWTFILLALAPMVLWAIAAIAGGSNAAFEKSGPAVETGLTALNGTALVAGVLVMLVLIFVIGPALVYTQVKSVQAQKVGVGDAFKKGLHYALRFLGLSICVGLLVVVGLILLIVPGLIMIRRYFLSTYLLIEQDQGVFETMRRSAALSKGNGRSMAIWGVIGVTFLISLLGIIPILGTIASFVLGIAYYCAPAVRYFQLKGLAPETASPAPQEPAAS